MLHAQREFILYNIVNLRILCCAKRQLSIGCGVELENPGGEEQKKKKKKTLSCRTYDDGLLWPRHVGSLITYADPCSMRHVAFGVFWLDCAQAQRARVVVMRHRLCALSQLPIGKRATFISHLPPPPPPFASSSYVRHVDRRSWDQPSGPDRPVSWGRYSVSTLSNNEHGSCERSVRPSSHARLTLTDPFHSNCRCEVHRRG